MDSLFNSFTGIVGVICDSFFMIVVFNSLVLDRNVGCYRGVDVVQFEKSGWKSGFYGQNIALKAHFPPLWIK
jgi:hypothetical protein